MKMLENFAKYYNEKVRKARRDKNVQELSLALEHQTYRNIQGTSNSVRHDRGNTNTRTQGHAHVFAKRNGGGKELYAVNMDGTGHDGSSGTVISSKHAAFFRNLGFDIPGNLTLESLNYESITKEDYMFHIETEDVQP